MMPFLIAQVITNTCPDWVPFWLCTFAFRIDTGTVLAAGLALVAAASWRRQRFVHGFREATTQSHAALAPLEVEASRNAGISESEACMTAAELHRLDSYANMHFGRPIHTQDGLCVGCGVSEQTLIALKRGTRNRDGLCDRCERLRCATKENVVLFRSMRKS